MCAPECPVNATVKAAVVSEAQRRYIAPNARLAKGGYWPPIRREQPPLPDHTVWRDVAAKVHLLVLPDLQAKSPASAYAGSTSSYSFNSMRPYFQAMLRTENSPNSAIISTGISPKRSKGKRWIGLSKP